MTPSKLYAEATLGGPGLSGYAYKADVYCVPCAEEIIANLIAKGTITDMITDSDTLPQPICFGEHEIKQHCAYCQAFLYGGNLGQ